MRNSAAFFESWLYHVYMEIHLAFSDLFHDSLYLWQTSQSRRLRLAKWSKTWAFPNSVGNKQELPSLLWQRCIWIISYDSLLVLNLKQRMPLKRNRLILIRLIKSKIIWQSFGNNVSELFWKNNGQSINLILKSGFHNFRTLCKGYKPKTVHSVRERTDRGP